MRTGEPPEVAEPTLVIPDNPGGLFSPGRSILDGFCASVRGSYGENAIRGSGVTTPREASLPQALVNASRCGRSRFWWTQLGTLHIPCGVPRAQVQALALLMQCRSAAPLVVGLGWVFASSLVFFGHGDDGHHAARNLARPNHSIQSQHQGKISSPSTVRYLSNHQHSLHPHGRQNAAEVRYRE